MYTELGRERLKSGEVMEVGVVDAPDEEWLPRVAPFLGHKNNDYRAHIRRALEGPLDGLETRFYVGHVGGRLISQIQVVGARGVGILGHVFTLPEERRKGACRAVMQHQMEHSRRAGFRVLCLGTGFESPPYWIYHSFGFRSVGPGNGCMKWTAEPGAEEELFRPGATTIRNVCWGDWGYFDLLALQPVGPNEELPRCPTLGLKGQGSVEGPFIGMLLRREREALLQAKALVTESGATVGWALLGPDTRWNGDVWLLDVYTHPHFMDRQGELLQSLELPEAPVAAYVGGPAGPRTAALRAVGFAETVSLPGWLEHDGRRRNL
ncbi:MAG TPA: GNAT family N-acetyltransferase, partial [Armatimonadota bacterium]|nr:GNAT family N-acetyltransferase [Armatimonadota bacterium]